MGYSGERRGSGCMPLIIGAGLGGVIAFAWLSGVQPPQVTIGPVRGENTVVAATATPYATAASYATAMVPTATFVPLPTSTPEPTATPVPPEVQAIQLLNQGWQLPISNVYTEWNSFAAVDVLIEHEKDVRLSGSLLTATNSLLEALTGDTYNTTRISGYMEIPVNARPVQETVAINAAPSLDPQTSRIKVTYPAPQFRLGLVNPEMDIMGSSRYTNRVYSAVYATEGSQERETINAIYREAMLLRAMYDACSASPMINPMTMELGNTIDFLIQDLLNRYNLAGVPFGALPSGPITFDYASCGSSARAEREHRIQQLANGLPNVRAIIIQMGQGWQLQLR